MDCFWLLLLVLLGVVSSINYAVGQCYTCLAANIACISDTQFLLCSAGFPLITGGVFSCNIGELCTTTGCTTALTGVAACPLCNQCNSAGLACTSPSTYVQCINAVPAAIFSTACATGSYCDISGITVATICRAATGFPMCGVQPGATAGIPSFSGVVSTTATPVSAATAYCRQQIPGRYPVAFDSTCKLYYNCVDAFGNGTIVGGQYECPGSTLFSPSLRQCLLTNACQ